MKNLILILFLLLPLSCQNKEIVQNTTKNEIENAPEESPSRIYIEERDWDLFFKKISSGKILKNDFGFYIENFYMKRLFKDAGEKNDFYFRVATIINGEVDKTQSQIVGSLNVLFKEKTYYTITSRAMDKIEGKSVWQLQDISSFTTSIKRTGFFEATDTPKSYPIFNKEHNIYGVIDWDSPLIAPDTFIPAEKVIIVDPETFEISILDNEDESYKVFIDIAYLE